ncbi:hypothetical protein [Mucilaginibacter ginkgonis]|uniref:Outer membrane protein with beta-barrel domain n=1 Tax=Mucilaginibacter ginkgonis TaxID=2682091 RepID=A0A6I4IPF0_9SPHI|nr:hypothetical protein [Mucilaginibacter ginkgonis]QQL50749.1 hypothetical protein GO620_004630 [Mucilaginibacter ginkgonis]
MKKIFYTLALVAGLSATNVAKAQTTDQDKQPVAATTQTDYATGQNAAMWKHNIAGAAGIQVTYRHYNLDQINQALNANGIPSLGNSDIFLNLTMDHIHGAWIFEDGLGLTPLTTSRNNNFKASFGQAQAYFRAGYNVTKGQPVSFFPFAGLNFSGAMLHLKDEARENTVNNFTTGLLASTSSKTYYQGNFGIELGAGLDYNIKMKSKVTDCVTIDRSIPIGIRAGYYINAARGDWKFSDHTLDGSPTKNQSAVFVSFSVGLGYSIHKQ